MRSYEHHTGVTVTIPDTVADHEVEGYANRVVAEAEARQADERALMKTIGQGLFGCVALGSAVVLMWREAYAEALAAAIGSAFAFGILTWAQIMEWRGRR